MQREINAELLLGRQVQAANGKLVGRIEEIVAEPQGSVLTVSEFHLGSYALMERLAASLFGRALLEFFGGGKLGQGYRVPWHKLDLTDPEKPKLLCEIDELETLERDQMASP
jgi:sporulation protein YlmC with PRC-barrel domain